MPALSLQHSPLFTRWTDPKSGVESFILTKRIAPLQSSFYFVNPSTSSDGRYYWFYCAFPPSGNVNYGRLLAVIDFADETVCYFPETQFLDASPAIHPETGEVYWCSGLDIWKRGPEPEAKVVHVNRFPEKLAYNRRPWRIATHLTFSADGKYLNIDAEFAGEWFVGAAPVNGGEVEIWQKFDRCYNHSSFSPTDPDLQAIAQSESLDPLTGRLHHLENHLWLIRRGGKASPIFPDPLPYDHVVVREKNPHVPLEAELPRTTDQRAMHGHHFWGADGQHLWYSHYHTGVERVRIGTSTPELMWPHKTVSHANADAGEKLLVLDCLPPSQPDEWHVSFVNLETNRSVHIVSNLPQPEPALQRYHVHPHPQFCLSDRYICYTTTVCGQIDVAFVPVDSLVGRTS